MMSSAHRFLLNAKPDRSYVIPDKEAERFLTSHGYTKYQKPNLPFMILMPKGVAYGVCERKRIRRGRAG